MKSEIGKIIDAMNINEHPHSIFNTEDTERVRFMGMLNFSGPSVFKNYQLINNYRFALQHVSDKYFIDSVDKIRFFYEEGAFNKSGQMVVDKQHAFNKIGHGFHE